ncbi:MAG: AAA family ATPase [Actinomycetota bacterium]
MAREPVLIVVSGIPGAGKSTVGRAIADRLDLTFLDKDDFLEDLFATSLDVTRHALSRQADEHFLEAVWREPEAAAVSFWRRTELSTTSGTPIDQFPTNRRLIEVWCDCPPVVAHQRFFARVRHSAHGDQRRDRVETLAQFQRLAQLGPLGVGHLIRVDTNQRVDIDDIGRQLASDPAAPPRDAVRGDRAPRGAE